jgi:hypothetical protein
MEKNGYMACVCVLWSKIVSIFDCLETSVGENRVESDEYFSSRVCSTYESQVSVLIGINYAALTVGGRRAVLELLGPLLESVTAY